MEAQTETAAATKRTRRKKGHKTARQTKSTAGDYRAKKEIAAAMHMSIHTVDKHATHLMAKLGLHDRVELARFAIREGFVQA